MTGIHISLIFGVSEQVMFQDIVADLSWFFSLTSFLSSRGCKQVARSDSNK